MITNRIIVVFNLQTYMFTPHSEAILYPIPVLQCCRFSVLLDKRLTILALYPYDIGFALELYVIQD